MAKAKKDQILAIEIIKGTSISGQPVALGSKHLVPEEVGEKDAADLIRMGRAKAIARKGMKPKADNSTQDEAAGD